MDDEVFNTVLTRLRPYSPEWVATAHCGESLLHPQFADRVAALSAAGHPLLLMTNGTRLTEKLTEFLLGMDVFGASFNFPSLIPSQWASFMCLPQHLFERTRKAIEGFISLFGHRVRELNIIVNAISEDQEARAEAIRAHFNVFGPVRVIATPSNSRAGAIDNPEVVSVKHTAADTFAGCDYVASQLHVTWTGEICLCGHDYHQQVILGDLMTQSVEEVMHGIQAVQFRKEVFGQAPMGKQRLCLRCIRLRTEAWPHQSFEKI